MCLWKFLASLPLLLFVVASVSAQEPKRLLLLGQGPDGHPERTHEYMAGVRLLGQCLEGTTALEFQLHQADEPWAEGPDLIRQADGVVIFLSEGAKWIHDDPRRLEALVQLAQRGGGFVGLHWGIGCKEAEHIDNYLRLLGGCHGGPDRKYAVVETDVQVVDPQHPVTAGVGNFRVREEFYYRLKFVPPEGSIQPLLRATIEDRPETVAWAWQRPDGGRSCGFSGLHFHDNWQLPEYRRFITQATLWALRLPIPAGGLSAEAIEAPIELP